MVFIFKEWIFIHTIISAFISEKKKITIKKKIIEWINQPKSRYESQKKLL